MVTSKGNRSIASLTNEALEALGAHASLEEVKKWISDKYKVHGGSHTNFYSIRKKFGETHRNNLNGEKEEDIPDPVTEPIYDPAPAGGSKPVVEAVRLVKQAMEAVGGKEALLELLSLLS